MLFSKKRTVKSFEKRQQELIEQRTRIYKKALKHLHDRRYAPYISACRRFLDAARNAMDSSQLIQAEQIADPKYLLP